MLVLVVVNAKSQDGLLFSTISTGPQQCLQIDDMWKLPRRNGVFEPVTSHGPYA